MHLESGFRLEASGQKFSSRDLWVAPMYRNTIDLDNTSPVTSGQQNVLASCNNREPRSRFIRSVDIPCSKPNDAWARFDSGLI